MNWSGERDEPSWAPSPRGSTEDPVERIRDGVATTSAITTTTATHRHQTGRRIGWSAPSSNQTKSSSGSSEPGSG